MIHIIHYQSLSLSWKIGYIKKGRYTESCWLYVQTFLGNKNGDTWKRHCLHRYYGEPVKTRYVRFIPLTFEVAVCMRLEAYGFRGELTLLKKHRTM